MRYWWVNHKQTSRHEISGGFLWSPMRKADGRSNYFYDTMRKATPGDLVLSFSNAQIRFVGVVADYAMAAPKPPSFGGAGQNWDKKNGWLLAVDWQALPNPVIPKKKISELRDVLPSKYSPIRPSTGDGNQSAYLAEVSEEVLHVLIGQVLIDLKNEKRAVAGRASKVVDEIDEAIEKAIYSEQGLDSTTKQRLVSARIGQGFFKAQIYGFESACRLTLIETAGLLIASHIKPWRLCDTAYERLDGANGLLLTPHVDFLFDRGFISFNDDGGIIVSERIKKEDLIGLGLGLACQRQGKAFHQDQRKYLAFHRKNIFLGHE